MDLSSLRIGYVPYDCSLRLPGDRRRFCHYAKERKIKFEIARSSDRYDLLVLSAGADPSIWSRYPKRDTKIVYQYINSYLAEPRFSPHRMFRGVAKFLLRQSRHLLLDYSSGIQRICQKADAVVCTTLEQEKQISGFTDNVHLILDFHGHLVRNTKSDYSAGEIFNFVWEGLPENLRFFAEVSAVLRRIQKKRKIGVHVVTDLEYGQYLGRKVNMRQTYDVARKFFDNVHVYSWNEDLLSSIITACDLALIPLPVHNPVEAGKPENKLLLFWKLGMPTVVSSTPAYVRAMRQCGLEMHCLSEQQWEQTLLAYMADEEARREAGQRGKAFAEERHGEQIILKRWDALFSSVLGAKEAEPAPVPELSNRV
jgi:hypothetical protein